MFSNLRFKVLALVMAIFLWIFVVSIENTIVQLKDQLQLKVFNLGADLAIASELPKISLTIRSSDSVTATTLSADDFEAFIDLRNVGAGEHDVQVSVSSKNPQANVFKISPQKVTLTLEPIRQKKIPITVEVFGKPSDGLRVVATKPLQDSVNVKGAETAVATLGKAVAVVQLDGSEKENQAVTAVLSFRDRSGNEVENIVPEKTSVEVSLTFEATMTSKSVGISPLFKGAPRNGVVKNITVEPAIVRVQGEVRILEKLLQLETEEIDLDDVTGDFEKKVDVKLPAGVQVDPRDEGKITVRVDIE